MVRESVLFTQRGPMDNALPVRVANARCSCFGFVQALDVVRSQALSDVVVEQANPADSTLAVKMIERHKRLFGRFPRRGFHWPWGRMVESGGSFSSASGPW